MSRRHVPAQAQAQITRTDQNQELLTFEQSMLVVTTFLKAALGEIAFTRCLLPAENFDERYLQSKKVDGPGLSQSSQISRLSQASQTYTSNFSIKMINSTSKEGKQLADLLDSVIDGVRMGYVRQCVFGIYLSEDDPNNMLETYTFDFDYSETTQGERVPFASMVAKDNRKKEQPRVASKSVWTLKAVKETLKTVLGQISTISKKMAALPGHRHATFKLYYYDERVPENWEPKHFSPVVDEDHVWYFQTHNPNEKPEFHRTQSFLTGHHGVDLGIASIAHVLPKDPDENGAFEGTTLHPPTPPNLVEQAQNSARIARMFEDDARQRMIRWDESDILELDAEGEVDPSLVEKRGRIPHAQEPPVQNLQDFNNRFGFPVHTTAAETQDLGDVVTERSLSTGRHTYKTVDYNSRRLLSRPRVAQELPSSLGLGKRPSSVPVATDDGAMDVDDTGTLGTSGYDHHHPEQADSMACPCGVKEPNPDSIQCDCCSKWFHISCVGYHCSQDERLPPGNYKCFDCDLRSNGNYGPLNLEGKITGITASYAHLARMRRSIKVVQTHKVKRAASFSRASGFDPGQANLIWTRLENEGFIEAMYDYTDKNGIFVEERPVKANRKKPVKIAADKIKWRFVSSVTQKAQYHDYFDPTPEPVWRLLGLSNETQKILKSGMKKARAQRAFSEVRNMALNTPAVAAQPTAPEVTAPRTRTRAVDNGRATSPTTRDMDMASSSTIDMARAALDFEATSVYEGRRPRKRPADVIEGKTAKRPRVSRGGDFEVEA